MLEKTLPKYKLKKNKTIRTLNTFSLKEDLELNLNFKMTFYFFTKGTCQ